MPELAEADYFRKRWQYAAGGSTVTAVSVHPGAKIFRGADPAALARALRGQKLLGSQTGGKQMLFRFSGGCWLGIHLGMSGELRVEPPGFLPGKHDHLVLQTARHALVFNDPRMFGRVRFDRGLAEPAWWRALAPPVLSAAFSERALAAFLRRRGRAPIKAVLLMQERFPGVGNWMADEILWRAGIHPRQPAGSLRPADVRSLWRECRQVCRLALAAIAGRGLKPAPTLKGSLPKSWLFNHRWEEGGRDPRTGTPLARATIGGRTTCWSPARQKFRAQTPT